MNLVKKMTVLAVYDDSFFMDYLKIVLMPFDADVVGTSHVKEVDGLYKKNAVDLTIVEETIKDVFKDLKQPILVLPNINNLKKACKENSRSSSLFVLHEIWKTLFPYRPTQLVRGQYVRNHERANISMNLNWRPMLDLQFQSGSVMNISRGGAGLKTENDAPSPGDLVEISGNPPLHGFCVVRWVQPKAEDHSSAFGVQFIATNKMVRAGLI